MTKGDWACPFCGRYSAQEPGLKRRAHSHHVETCLGSNFAVYCWYCGARGPLAGSVAQALRRWEYSADRLGAPQW